jgi:hypothetical protein
MLKLTFLFILSAFLTSCEVCYKCDYQGLKINDPDYTEERCDSKNNMEEFIPQHEEQGWVCKEI